MSINFSEPMNQETHRKLLETFGEKLKAIDRKTALLEELSEVDRKAMSDLANVAKQPVTVELNTAGDRKTVAGTEYVLAADGWRKV